MDTDAEQRRMRWASRRGMLELDLMLGPFVDRVWSELSERERQVYHQLMECEDQQLYGWLMNRGLPEEAELRALVERISSFRRSLR